MPAARAAADFILGAGKRLGKDLRLSCAKQRRTDYHGAALTASRLCAAEAASLSSYNGLNDRSLRAAEEMLESAMLKIEYDKPLAALTTFHLRANAEAWVEVASLEDIRDALSVARGRGWQTTILGGGSNVVPMPLVPGLVIHPVFRGIHEAQSESGSLIVVAGAAEALDDLVRCTVGKGLGGLENLAAIPGSVGGAVVQNAGAYGVEMAERIAWVRVYDPDIDDFRTLTPTECDFGYRTSIFKSKAGSRLIITEAAFVLPQVWQPVTAYKGLSSLFADRDPASVTPAEVETAVRNLRAQKLPDPSQTGSAGSFFKNPVVTKLKARELITLHPNLVSYPLAGGRAKLAAGWLIEAAGLKGLSSGDAAVWPAHALILINRGRATGEDVLKLGREIAERVERRFGVVLEPEPIFLGADFR
ncbi:UDP-N-acetylmuramate dehydrogenase [Sutterella wadsworthensis]|uniref:UDP-N-acetylmuramate dehydrogenase n=1 Tax=Sutterella wadsworthensis TaxID=40545 RepID=UPI00266C0D1B|nr:UDP-N-acetylmuramate dehydrogenase [Sutterella wadsworthensis]